MFSRKRADGRHCSRHFVEFIMLKVILVSLIKLSHTPFMHVLCSHLSHPDTAVPMCDTGRHYRPRQNLFNWNNLYQTQSSLEGGGGRKHFIFIISLHSYQNCTGLYSSGTYSPRQEQPSSKKKKISQASLDTETLSLSRFCSNLKKKKNPERLHAEHVAVHLLMFLHRILYATAELHLVTLCVGT